MRHIQRINEKLNTFTFVIHNTNTICTTQILSICPSVYVIALISDHYVYLVITYFSFMQNYLRYFCRYKVLQKLRHSINSWLTTKTPSDCCFGSAFQALLLCLLYTPTPLKCSHHSVLSFRTYSFLHLSIGTKYVGFSWFRKKPWASSSWRRSRD